MTFLEKVVLLEIATETKFKVFFPHKKTQCQISNTAVDHAKTNTTLSSLIPLTTK